MNDLGLLYQKLSEIDYRDFYELETDFCTALSRNFSENPLPWVTAFLTISNWFGTSQRSGVWTFYEVCALQEMERTIQYLRENGDTELATVFEKGIEDYQNPQYAKNGDYPEEWIEESGEIDEWISGHEDWLWKWQYDVLMKNRDHLLKS